MTLLLVLFGLALIAGLVLSFGDTCSMFLLKAGAGIQPLSWGALTVMAVIIAIWFLLWIFTSMVNNPNSFLYREVISDGNEESFFEASRKLVRRLAILIAFFSIATIALLFSTTALGNLQSNLSLWFSENGDLVSHLHWIGNMLLSASIAFSISIAIFATHRTKRGASQKKKPKPEGKSSVKNSTPRTREKEDSPDGGIEK